MLSTIQFGRASVMNQASRLSPRSRALGRGLRVALLVFLVLGAAQSASAQEMLRTAKNAQQVGEKLDGFLAVVDKSAPAKVKKMVENTNSLRKNRYQKVASMRGATLESVGKQAAEILFERAVAGDLLESAGGKWKQKE